ncbi:hypothetical protein ACWJJH_04305 [Endozoicomonadaceae bacterium StTr2]
MLVMYLLAVYFSVSHTHHDRSPHQDFSARYTTKLQLADDTAGHWTPDVHHAGCTLISQAPDSLLNYSSNCNLTAVLYSFGLYQSLDTPTPTKRLTRAPPEAVFYLS